MRYAARAPATQVLGRTKLDLPDTCGRSSFYLATHWTGEGSLRHYLTGLQTLERSYREVELLVVGGSKVKKWSHSAVSCFLQRHLGHVTSATEFKMVLRATDYSGQRHIVEIQFEVLYEDGGSASDKVRAVFDVIIRVVDNVITKPVVTDVTYEQCCYIRVRHAALIGHFLRVADDHTLCMDIPGSPDDYVFKCYTFFGHNQTVSRRGRSRCPRRCRGDSDASSSSGGGGGGGGGVDGGWPRMCVLQEPRTSRYVIASALNGSLKIDDEGRLHTDIASILKPDPRFFLLHQSGDGGGEQFCLRPLILSNYFLRYDVVEGLKLERCDCPPYLEPNRVRHFAFDFMPAKNLH
ncbi:hypothetical protein ACOMHN_018939 [Nucella lapillus]